MLFALASFFAAAGNGGGEAAPGPGGGNIFANPLFLVLILMVVGYLVLLRPMQQRERAQREALLGAIKKTDRVITTSGIYGIVANVDREAGKVTIRVDESTNAKLEMSLSAIAQILTDPAAEDKPK